MAAALLTGAGLAACGADTLRTVEPFAPTVIDAARLVQPPQPPRIIAASARDIADAAAATAPDRLDSLRSKRGATFYEGPQAPFFFESEIGRAYLSAGPGRAWARGAPAASCPFVGVALDAADPAAAARAALEACLARRPAAARDECACRLLAVDDLLLAADDAYAYPRGVAAKLVPLEPAGPEIALIAEQFFAPTADGGGGDMALSAGDLALLAAGGARLRLRPLSGEAARLDLRPDGTARLFWLDDGGAALTGAWSSEGFRRGRLTRLVALRHPDGRAFTLQIGYDPEEATARRAELQARARALF